MAPTMLACSAIPGGKLYKGWPIHYHLTDPSKPGWREA
jgi:hypothetical protein